MTKLKPTPTGKWRQSKKGPEREEHQHFPQWYHSTPHFIRQHWSWCIIKIVCFFLLVADIILEPSRCSPNFPLGRIVTWTTWSTLLNKAREMKMTWTRVFSVCHVHQCVHWWVSSSVFKTSGPKNTFTKISMLSVVARWMRKKIYGKGKEPRDFESSYAGGVCSKSCDVVCIWSKFPWLWE